MNEATAAGWYFSCSGNILQCLGECWQGAGRFEGWLEDGEWVQVLVRLTSRSEARHQHLCVFDDTAYSDNLIYQFVIYGTVNSEVLARLCLRCTTLPYIELQQLKDEANSDTLHDLLYQVTDMLTKFGFTVCIT